MNNSRSTMYYGSLETNKLSRRFRKHYAADGSMEIKQDMVNGTVEFLTYIAGDAYSAPIVLKSDGTTQNYLYLHRDYLGSIVAITNQAGAVVEKRMFDAWGNITKVQDGTGNVLTGLVVLDRGYTGHEHLQGVNLIHMNGRLYDPVVHRFLQPDNYIQDPYKTQNFNRYGYVLNNPLKHNDKSGEFLSIVVGFFEGFYNVFNHGVNFHNYNWEKTQNAWKIDMGLFKVDPNRTFLGQFLQIFSRFTWEALQTSVGYLYSQSRNIAGEVDEVKYFGGATFIINENTEDRWGISLGNYINANIRGELKENHPNGWMFSEDGLFWHEYGHTHQSMRFGLSYLFAVGIPSITEAEWTENSANRWAWRYANQHGYMQNWLYPINHPQN